MKTKTIEISGKKYTLTANRSIIKTLANVAPNILKLGKAKKDEISDDEFGISTGLDIMANLDVLFYDMIKVAHTNISKEKSDEILDAFEDEYDGVQEKLIELAMSVFQSGDQVKTKKKIDW